MARIRTLLASVLAGGFVTASALTLTAPAAHAAVDGCADLSNTSVLVYFDRFGGAYSIENELVNFDATTCYYTGGMYYSAGQHGTSYVGPYSFNRKRT